MRETCAYDCWSLWLTSGHHNWQSATTKAAGRYVGGIIQIPFRWYQTDHVQLFQEHCAHFRAKWIFCIDFTDSGGQFTYRSRQLIVSANCFESNEKKPFDKSTGMELTLCSLHVSVYDIFVALSLRADYCPLSSWWNLLFSAVFPPDTSICAPFC